MKMVSWVSGERERREVVTSFSWHIFFLALLSNNERPGKS
jgi:hypothetical protein